MAARMPAIVSDRMRLARRCAAAAAMIACAFAGCLSPLTSSSQIVQRFRSNAGGTAVQDSVTLDVAVLEVSLVDRALIASIWTSADEQVVPAEHKSRLEDNGFRVGIIGGIPPAALLSLLTSERSNASPHQWIRKPGEAKTLAIGSPIPDLKCEIAHTAETPTGQFENAHCGWTITAGIKGDDVTLQFVPQIQHGKRNLWPSADGVGNWMMQGQRPVERFAALKFETALSGSEYLLVGMREKPSSLGEAFFRSTGDRPVERLIAIRAGRTSPANDPLSQKAGGFQPLAVQAAQTRVRGVAADR